MNERTFADRIEAARKQLDILIERASEAGEGDELLHEAREQLGNVLEELQAAGEEMAEQNDELAAARRAVETERELYRDLFESAPGAYLVTTRDGIIREANRVAGAMLGVDARELIGKPLVLFVASTQRRTFYDLICRIEGASEALEVELELLPRGGAPFPASTTAIAERDGDRAAESRGTNGIRWLMRDISRRRAAEGERERRLIEVQDRWKRAEAFSHGVRHEHTLQAVMENTQAQLAYLDAEFRFVRVNAAYAQGSGYRCEELIGRNHFALFPNAENQAIFERVRDTGESVSFRAKPFVYPARPELGTTYWDWKLTPIADADGKTCGLVLSLLDVTERERLLDLLASERARLHAVIAHAPEAIVVTDDRGRIVLANDAAQKLGFFVGVGTQACGLGNVREYSGDAREYSGDASQAKFGNDSEVADGRPIEQPIPPLMQAVAAGEPLRDVELTVMRAEGRDLLVSAAPIRDGSGKVSGGVAVLQDVTEWKRTQEALRRYAERLQILHEMDEAVLATYTVDGMANAALQHVWQLVPCLWAAVAMFSEELDEVALLAARSGRETPLTTGWRGTLDWSWFATELAQGQAHVVENLAALPRSSAVIDALREQGVCSYMNVPLIAQGRLIGSLNLGMADPEGLVPEHLDVVQEMANSLAIAIHQADLKERVARHAQELERRVVERTAALRASEARFRTIFEESAVGIALLDLEGRILDANPALQEMLDREMNELHGAPFAHYITVDDAGDEEDSYAALLTGCCDYYRTERRYVRHGGVEAWANLTFSLVRRHGGIPWFAIVMVDDVTEDRTIRAALVEAEKLALTGRLVASLTHEINNPLQAVIGCLGLAQEALAEGSNADRFLTVAREELRRTASIVGHLRSLYRPIHPDVKEPGDANALIREVLDLSRKQIAGRGIYVITKWGDLPSVPMMVDRMRQVVLNLILNAVDAMPDGGRLYIETTATDHPKGVCISCRDEGVGIPAEVLPHIFDSFYSTKPDGLGLGLFITRGIVREHGGTITATSQPGKGTIFSVWLPSKPPEADRACYNDTTQG